MTKRTGILIFPAVVAVSGICAFAGQADATVAYPEGFRKWALVKSTIMGPQHGVFSEKPCEKPCTGGLFHFYANAKALEGYRTGKFPEGAVIADELLETKASETAGVTLEGPRRGVGVMVKDSRRFGDTGGWGFETFDGGSRTEGRLSVEEKKACFTCHMAKKDRDFVFTQYRE